MRGRAVWLAALREVVRAHEVSNREALSRRCRPQEEYQSRRDRLEGIERDCYLPRSDLGRLARHNRFHAKSGKSIISGSPVRLVKWFVPMKSQIVKRSVVVADQRRGVFERGSAG